MPSDDEILPGSQSSMGEISVIILISALLMWQLNEER